LAPAGIDGRLGVFWKVLAPAVVTVW
jgi:hypothetical protein